MLLSKACHCRVWHGQRRSGAIIFLLVVLMIVLVGIVALAVDIGMMVLFRAQIQNAVDAGALAAVLQLNEDPTDISKAEAAAKNFVQLNRVGTIVTIPDRAIEVERGVFDPEERTFTPTDINPNAIRVHANQANEPFIFARVFGYESYEIPASAVASVGTPTDIMMVLDLSGSMKDEGRIEALQAATPIFVDTIASYKAGDQVGVMGLSAFPDTYSKTKSHTLPANRQRIVELFPTAHRRAFRLLVRHRIVGIGGGTSIPSRRSVPYPAISCG